MVSKLLGEGEGEVVGGRVEEERKESIWVGAGQNRDRKRVVNQVKYMTFSRRFHMY